MAGGRERDKRREQAKKAKAAAEAAIAGADDRMAAGRWDDALNMLLRAEPQAPEAEGRRGEILARAGECLLALGKTDQAVRTLERAVACAPQSYRARLKLSQALYDLGRADDSIPHLEEAVRIAPTRPAPNMLLAEAARLSGRLDAAVAFGRQAVALGGTIGTSYAVLAEALRDQGDLPAAETAGRAAIRLDPHNPLFRISLARILLTAGRYAEGFAEWEHRLGDPFFAHANPAGLGIPRWEGQDLAGKTVLVLCEQGFGDTLQFVRYAERLRGRGAKTLCWSYPELTRLFQSSQLFDACDERIERLPRADYRVACGSLPHLLGTRDSCDIPARTPYLSAEAQETKRWRERLATLSGLRVGLAWAGRPTLQEDRMRSMPPALLAPILRVDGVSFVGLQKWPAGELPLPEGASYLDAAAESGDFATTAAVISGLDLVIAVDTAVAHLAGALGKPVWMMSRFGGCWRWRTSGEDSPWYPSLRVLRLPAPGAWGEVVAQITAELTAASR